MVRILGFRVQQDSRSSPGPSQTVQGESAPSTASPGYPKGYTAFGKILKPASQDDVAKGHRRFILGKNGRNDQDRKDRPSKKTSSEKCEIKEQANCMLDLNKLSSSSEEISEDCVVPSYDTVMSNTDQLRTEVKDSESLNVVCSEIHSYKMPVEHQKHVYKLFREESEEVGNDLSEQQKEKDLSASEEGESQLKPDNAKLQLSSQRFTLENSNLEETLRQQARPVEQPQRNLPDNDKEELKKRTELCVSVTKCLEEMMRNNEIEKEIARYKDPCEMNGKNMNAHVSGELPSHGAVRTSDFERDDETITLRRKLEDKTTELQHLVSEYQHEEQVYNCMAQKLLTMTSARKKWEILEKRIKEHEEEISNLKTYMKTDAIERSMMAESEHETEEEFKNFLVGVVQEINIILQKHAKYTEVVRQNQMASVKTDTKQKAKSIESKMIKSKAHLDFIKLHLGMYKQLYEEEQKSEESLKYEINLLSTSRKQLRRVNSRLIMEKEMNTHCYTGVVTEESPVRNRYTFGLNRIVPRANGWLAANLPPWPTMTAWRRGRRRMRL